MEYVPRYMKMCRQANADSEGPDQPVRPRSLISAYVVRKHNHWIRQNILTESKRTNETLSMCRMMPVCTF